MKKCFYSIFAALVAVAACTSFKEEASLPVVNATDPSITIGEVGETTFSAVINAAEGTGFYSYAVMAGAAKELDPTTLFKVGYKSSSVVCGTVDFAKKASFEVVAGTVEKPLTRNADYTIYAVAASVQGTVGNVVYKTVHTTDEQIPSAKSMEADGNVITITFSEAVTYDENKPATAKYYAAELTELNAAKDALAETGEMGDAKVVVAASGNTATFTVTLDDENELPAGAVFAVSYPEGAFKDKVGNEIKALVSGPVAKSEKIAWNGAVAQIDNVSWDLEDDDAEAEILSPDKKYFTFSIPEDVALFDISEEDALVTLKVISESTGKVSETLYTLIYDNEWGFMDESTLIVVYPDSFEINGGDTMIISIGEGSILDIYGNVSNAISHEYLYSYGYTIDDFVGTYSYEGYEMEDGGYEHSEDAVVIAPDPENEEGILIYNLFKSLENFNTDYFTTWEIAETPLKGKINVHNGEIEIEKTVVIYSESPILASGYGYVGTLSATFVMQMPQAGIIATGLRYYMDGTQYYWTDEEGLLERTSEEYEIPVEEPGDPIVDPEPSKANRAAAVKFVR